MAIYRFKVSFEDYDDIERDIDIKSNQTFEDLHRAIHQSTGYPAEVSSSFYVSNDQWKKSDEIAFLPNQRKVNNDVVLMSNSKLSSFIDDPHQKFYYIYNFDRPFDFHVELVKILLNNEALDKPYPFVSRSKGEVPKVPGLGGLPIGAITSTKSVSDDFDFLNELEFQPEDTEELEQMNELGINTEEVADDQEEKDDFMDEFSDNETYDSDDVQKDDY